MRQCPEKSRIFSEWEAAALRLDTAGSSHRFKQMVVASAGTNSK